MTPFPPAPSGQQSIAGERVGGVATPSSTRTNSAVAVTVEGGGEPAGSNPAGECCNAASPKVSPAGQPHPASAPCAGEPKTLSGTVVIDDQSDPGSYARAIRDIQSIHAHNIAKGDSTGKVQRWFISQVNFLRRWVNYNLGSGA